MYFRTKAQRFLQALIFAFAFLFKVRFSLNSWLLAPIGKYVLLPCSSGWLTQLVVHQWQLAELSSIDQPLSLKSAPPYAKGSLSIFLTFLS